MEVPRHWRLKQQRYGLVGEVCPHCDFKIFPPRDLCPECGEEAREPYVFSGRGEVYSFTPMYDTPTGFSESAPYVIALVKLEEGPIITSQLTDVDFDQVEIGMTVEMVTRRLRNDQDDSGIIIYGYKFRPILVDPR